MGQSLEGFYYLIFGSSSFTQYIQGFLSPGPDTSPKSPKHKFGQFLTYKLLR